MKAYDRVLTSWKKQWKEENLSGEVIKLIRQAVTDLYAGPIGDGSYGDPADYDPEGYGDYPGFYAACRKIKEALQDVPSVVYINTLFEDWQETEPTSEECPTCEGTGMDKNYQDEDEVKCDNCYGEGYLEPRWEDWIKVDRSDLKKAIVGKELSNYV